MSIIFPLIEELIEQINLPAIGGGILSVSGLIGDDGSILIGDDGSTLIGDS